VFAFAFRRDFRSSRDSSWGFHPEDDDDVASAVEAVLSVVDAKRHVRGTSNVAIGCEEADGIGGAKEKARQKFGSRRPTSKKDCDRRICIVVIIIVFRFCAVVCCIALVLVFVLVLVLVLVRLMIGVSQDRQ